MYYVWSGRARRVESRNHDINHATIGQLPRT